MGARFGGRAVRAPVARGPAGRGARARQPTGRDRRRRRLRLFHPRHPGVRDAAAGHRDRDHRLLLRDRLVRRVRAAPRRARSGPSQQRVRAAAAGAFLFGLTLLAALLRPVSADVADIATRVLALASALAFVAAFTPPRFVRQAWSEPVVRSLVEYSGKVLALRDPAQITGQLEAMARDTTGSQSARVFR